LESAFPALQKHTLAACLIVLLIVTRKLARRSRFWSCMDTAHYAYVGGMFVVIVLGVWKTVQSGGNPTPAVSPPPVPLDGRDTVATKSTALTHFTCAPVLATANAAHLD
jgi:hypothetical protein